LNSPSDFISLRRDKQRTQRKIGYYLKAPGLKLRLEVNFSSYLTVEIERIVLWKKRNQRDDVLRNIFLIFHFRDFRVFRG